MSEDTQNTKNESQAPGFELKPRYIDAFMTLLLSKAGGVERITIEQLEKFDENDHCQWYFDKENNAWIVAMPGAELTAETVTQKLKNRAAVLLSRLKPKRKRGIIKPNKKLFIPN